MKHNSTLYINVSNKLNLRYKKLVLQYTVIFCMFCSHSSPIYHLSSTISLSKSTSISPSSSLWPVIKLAYVKIGTHKVIKSWPSGSYTLQHHTGSSIKKHGSDLYLCPKELVPSKPISSSDDIFSFTLQTFVRSSSSCTNLNIEKILAHLAFPTVEELNNEIDSWP